jgi:alkylation response protein AidB-like acyl-CoA dehydrogenase
MTSHNYLAIATQLTKELAAEFDTTAIERDKTGGTPKHERDRLRESGLLKIATPKIYGGWELPWHEVFKISREFGKVDSAIAHVFSYHHLGVTIPHIFGSPEQKEKFYTETVKNNWFWCNALNPLDRRATLTKDGEIFRLNGMKSFCSGSKDSDILPITAVNQETSELTVLAIPTKREGVTIHDDWDNIGQRQTDSGTVSFQQVQVFPQEIFGNRNQNDHPFKTIRACLTQLNLANIYLGIAIGAFEKAKEYTQTQTKPWRDSGVDRASQDPYILQNYGNMWVDLEATTALVDRAGLILQSAWEQEWDLTAQQRGETAIAIATAKVAAHKVGLDITSRIFDVMGARATAAKYGFDRYWRNLRTFTLHDPVEYKIKAIGDWALNDQIPNPDFYI